MGLKSFSEYVCSGHKSMLELIMAANDEVITYLFSQMPTKADAQITYYSLDSRFASLDCLEDSGGAPVTAGSMRSY